VSRAAVGLALTIAALAGVPGCSGLRASCEEVCSRFVGDCHWTAWANVEQCARGCIEDMYRRDDADAVLDCYERAADPMPRDEAEAAVDRAVEAGFWREEREDGTWDRTATVEAAMESSRCSPFEAVQCKVDAVLVEPKTALLR